MQYLIHLDVILFHFLNQSIANPVFDVVMPFVTNEDHFVIPILVVWMGLIIFGGKRGRIAAILLLIATGLSDSVAAQLIKPAVGRLRPCHALETVRLLVGCGGKYGFVSNHAANMFASMTTLSLFYRRYRGYFWSIAILIAFSRIYVGVHYPGDVLGGAIFGYFMAYLWFGILILLNNSLKKQGHQWLEWRIPAPGI